MAFLIDINLRSRLSNFFNGNIVLPSDSAFFGLGWVSKKIPFTFAATPAQARVSINSGVPPDTPYPWFGFCKEWVISKTTFFPKDLDPSF